MAGVGGDNNDLRFDAESERLSGKDHINVAAKRGGVGRPCWRAFAQISAASRKASSVRARYRFGQSVRRHPDSQPECPPKTSLQSSAWRRRIADSKFQRMRSRPT